MRRMAWQLAMISLAALVAACSSSQNTAQNCTSPEVSCSFTCVDISSDSKNCGSCGAECDAGVACHQGICGCPGSQTYCDGSCFDLSSDQHNCGACGVACDAGQVCSNGSCAETCAHGYSACPADAPEFCAQLDIDPNNCGGCGVVCDGGTLCSEGACEPPRDLRRLGYVSPATMARLV